MEKNSTVLLQPYPKRLGVPNGPSVTQNIGKDCGNFDGLMFSVLVVNSDNRRLNPCEVKSNAIFRLNCLGLKIGLNDPAFYKSPNYSSLNKT